MIRLPFISWLLFCLLESSAHGAPELPSTDERGSEAQLVKSLQAINDNHLDIALNEVDNLLSTNPNFKLAQLVKGDLLMARAGAIGNFGSAANASSEQIDDLRDEARVRLQRVLSRSDFNFTPRYLWKLDAGQKYALVVDTSRSTLFVYENVNGVPRYVTDYYITIGKLGTEKISEGDQRTPLGVYFVKGVLPKRQLADLYGSGAYPLSYPNEWDRRNNRTGSGIWLHGTPSDTYSRPPRASNGCVVLANEDLEKLASYLQVGITPVIITSRMDWDTELDVHERDDLLQEVEQWRKDWASLDTSAYLGHYAQDFSSDGMDYQSWMEKKQLVNKTKSWIKVGISNLSVFSYPEQPGLAVVSFEQDYSSSNLSNRMKKRQYWIRKSDRWQIVYEGGA
jgi:murein L,D-transpeptidase YafK